MFRGNWGILGMFGGPVAVSIYDLASTIYGSFGPAGKAQLQMVNGFPLSRE
jgi:hypothetical protein